MGTSVKIGVVVPFRECPRPWSVAEAEKWLAPVLNYDPLIAARTAAE